jgi:hypothetical protein
MLHVVMRLEVFIEICTFRHGNKYVPKSLIGIIQVVEKGVVNWVYWFSNDLFKKIRIM